MSPTITPNQPISLPYSHFYTSSKLSYAPHLKIKIKPHLLIPTPPFSPKVRSRKIEDYMDVIVPVGGKIPFNVKIDKNGLEDIGLGYKVEEQIIDLWIKALNNVQSSAMLGLLPLEPVIQPESSSTILLNPLTACPSHHVLSKNIVPSGSAIAYLTAIDISYEWVTYKPFGKNTRKVSAYDEEDEEGDDEQDDGDLLLIDEQEDIIEDHDSYTSAAVVDAKQDVVDDDDIQDAWLTIQIQECHNRLIKDHLIRRFPLIFDGGLLQYSSICEIPRALTSSLAQLLHLSATYATPLAKELKTAVKSISLHQDHQLSSAIHVITNLPTRKQKLTRTSESQESGSSPSKRRKGDELSSTAESGLMDGNSRAQAYITEVTKKRKQWEDEAGMKTEKKLKRIIGDVLGQIGRSTFEERRRRAGRLSYSRLNLSYIDQQELSGTPRLTPQSPTNANDDTAQVPQAQISQADDTEDELLIHEEDDYELYDEDEELLLEAADISDIPARTATTDFEDEDQLSLLLEDHTMYEDNTIEKRLHSAGEMLEANAYTKKEKEIGEVEIFRETAIRGEEETSQDEVLILEQSDVEKTKVEHFQSDKFEAHPHNSDQSRHDTDEESLLIDEWHD
ncbi:uncharacterized protein L201_005667 [Kwoniella dendrophila CBS 6074]|uniref:Uncharacterized protein n=1 Tax=Kwoniella dendrophila CBS 6074 TaxID=1295534 RepID=A0AAX4JZB1_9TREE